MLDFVSIKYKKRNGVITVYPEFKAKRSKDLMIRGKSFYAVWDEEAGYWSRDEYEVQRLVDKMIYQYVDEHTFDCPVDMKLMVDFSTNSWTEWQKYCKSLADNYYELDTNIKFTNSEIKKSDYVSHSLPYSMINQETPAYEELISTLYDESERRKIEWAIGAIIKGDSKSIQKFVVLYGAPGSGKSTILNIIQMMFPGYYSIFDSKALTKVSNAFALEAFRTNPLIAIEHDGDLSRIEDNTKLNSIVSHEEMMVNEKFKSTYMSKFNSFLFMGTNKPVKITDAKSGILRRLIDVQPSGRKIPRKRFEELMRQIQFELGGIADQCLERYKELGFNYYDDYIPLSMMGATNDFFNFIEDNYDMFIDTTEEGLSLNVAWKRYQEYCEDAKVSYPLSKRLFKDEMKNYFDRFEDRDGNRRSVFFGFKKEKLDYQPLDEYQKTLPKKEGWLKFDQTESLFDTEFSDCQAQYANDEGIPTCSWDKCDTKLSDLDTSKIHYVRPPKNLVVIDFDLKNEKGEKDYELNLRAAEKYPSTYAELSKSGSGIHLHYWYEGDVQQLSRISRESNEIEFKVFTGKSSLRRCVTRSNSIGISTISSGLPLKETKRMLKEETIQSERGLRELIKKNLKKEIHQFTKPSIDFIMKILDDAYEQGLKYDVRDMRPAVQNFALSSSHNADYCLKCVSKMKFASEEPSEDYAGYKEDAPIVFFDVEVFPNLFIVSWKKEGKDQKTFSLINPLPEHIEELCKNRLVGFNNRKYDNHILYAKMMGYTEEQLYKLSQRIIDGDKNAFFGEAYNLSYTDIYDFLSASNKMSLKKWEIKLGIHHQELGLPWNEPVPKNLWKKVAEYCENDVVATEATWLANQADWLARKILSLLSGLTENDTTNNHTTRIIIGKDKNPQSQYIYTNLSTIFSGYRYDPYGIPKDEYDEGVKIVSGKSIYRGEDPGEGGYVYAEPGIYYNVALLDIASMHPHSAIWLNIFGDKYTRRFKNIVEARVLIKHKDYEGAKQLLEEILDVLDGAGVLDEYLSDSSKAKALANALKTAINSVYGLTSAKFDNKLKDPRNVDNIVAKYGALFMINLKHEVQERGFTVVHIKTDSIKIADATPEIIEFVMDYGKQYGYTFEHEDTYSKICLVNDAVYIAKYKDSHKDEITGKDIWWTATGTQFQVPFVFKTLFSKEPIVFEDLCETKSVSTAMYLDFNENKPSMSSEEIKELDYLKGYLNCTSEDSEQYLRLNELMALEQSCHDYRFVGKVGCFCPMKDGIGAAILLRESVDNDGNQKFGAVTGTKKPDGKSVYKWMEAEMVLKLALQDQIDRSYYNKLVDTAVDTISKYGDFEMFVSDNVINDVDWMKIPDGVEKEIPFEDFMNLPKNAA